jgi:hypothetical protein
MNVSIPSARATDCRYRAELAAAFVRDSGLVQDPFEHVADFFQRRTRVITGEVHGFIDKGRRSIEEGERAYHDAGEQYRSRARKIESKNTEIASSIHHKVDKMSTSAVTVEHSVLDQLCEIGALYRGVERSLRTLLGKGDRRSAPEGPFHWRRGRVMGS